MDNDYFFWGPTGIMHEEHHRMHAYRAPAPIYLGGSEPWSPAIDPPTLGIYFPDRARYMMLGKMAEEVAK